MLYNINMKKIIIGGLMVVMFTVTAAPLAVHAQTSSTTTNTTSSTSTTAAAEAQALAGRVSAYKKKLTVAVTEATKQKILGKCVAAQGVVKVYAKGYMTSVEARTKRYTDIVADLKALGSALAAKGVDVKVLNTDITNLQTKIDAFTAADKTYQQDVADLQALDCKADPTAFQAALTVARTDHAAVLQAVTDVKTYLTGTIKPVLGALKAEAAKSQTTSQSTTSTNTSQQ